MCFVVGGLAAIWIGFAAGRGWCTSPWFRGPHLGAIGFVIVEPLLGYACPLTVWEVALRGSSAETGFIQRWVSAILYWNAPTWAFTAMYLALGALVAWTWIRVPPRWGRRLSGMPRPR